MKRALRLALIAGLALAIVLAIAAAGFHWFAPHETFAFTVDDDTFDFADADGIEWLFAAGGMTIAMLVVVVVVPLALLIALGVPALIAGIVLVFGVLLAIGILALVCSPLIVPALLLVWWLRRRRPAAVAAPSMTIPT